MKRSELSFVKILFLALLFLSTDPCFSQTPFSVSAPLESLESASSDQSADEPLKAVLARLKQDAVILWMRSYLGEKSSSFEKKVTPEFAESYLLDYRVNRVGENKNIVQLSGNLDTDSLKGWLRVSETKMASGSQLKPALIISTSPSISLNESQEGNLFSAIESGLNQEFKRLRLNLASASSAPFDIPPKDERMISRLSDFFAGKGNNIVIWVYLNRCKSCTGIRLDLFSYSLSQNHLMTSLSEEVPELTGSFQDPSRITAIFSPFFKLFQQDFERAIAEGKPHASALTLTVEGVENYRIYKKLEYLLSQQGFWSDWMPRGFVQGTAQFEAFSPLNAPDVARRIEALTLPEGKLLMVRVDSRNVVVRYSR